MQTKVFKALCFILALLPLFVAAQGSKTEKQAKDLFKYADYRDAQPLYKKLQEQQPDNPEFLAKYAICCLHSDYKRDALPFLLRAKDKNYNGDNIDYYLGKAFHLNHEFDKAISYFEKAKKGFDFSRDEKELKNINQQIQMCLYGKELVKAPVKVEIVNLGSYVNTNFPDFVPIVSADETTLIFTSRRSNTTGGQIEEETNHYYEDIYISHKNVQGEWDEPVQLSHNTNGHDACVSLSHQGDKLFIYRHENNGDIYQSVLKGKDWSKPQPLQNGINTKYSETSLSMSPDEKIIFFSSDRPGGLGGFDIYFSIQDTLGNWGAPVNAGPAINTPNDEDAPFVHADGKTLYFSSKGHNSMGGYDIFTSSYNIKEKFFTAPVNVGYPINTADDDIFFVWSIDGKRAYFSSVREDGFGEKDLYMLTRAIAEVPLIVVKGIVSNKADLNPVGANVKVYDNDTKELIQEFESNSSSGKYLVPLPPGKNYQLSVEMKGFLPYSENVYVPNMNEFFELEKDISLEPLKTGSIANLRNVFFDLDKATLRPESFIELDRFVRFMKEHPDLYFEVAGHTDSIGTNEYNYKLSDSRAHSVAKYLIEKGINKDRMIPVGYGEDYSVAANKSEEGRQLNRRTEIIIIDKPKALYTRKEGFYSVNNTGK